MARWSPKCILMDLSGTIHVGDQLIDGVGSALLRLKESGLFYKFVTNSSKESSLSIVSRLNKLGLDLSRQDVFTSLSAARQYIDSNAIRPMLFLQERALEEFEGVNTADANAVVVGLAPSMFHYNKLTEAFNLLKSGAKLIAVNKSRYFQSENGLVLGAGAFVSALEYSSDTKATIIGKPSKDFFAHSIVNFPGVCIEDCVMIGDDVRDDVAGAQAAGMRGILVKTGKYREDDEWKISPLPYMVTRSVVEAIDQLIELHDSKDT